MGFRNNKFEYSVAGLVIVLVAGLFHLFSGMQSRTQVESDIVYEMPRPKNFQGADFDLSNRQIDRNYINPFVKKEAEKAIAKAKAAAQAKAKAKAAEQAKKTAVAAAKAKAQVTARVVSADVKAPLGSDRNANTKNYNNNSNRNVASPKEAADNTNKKEDDTNKMSPDQWRALLLAQPTKANMDKLVHARNKDEVDSQTYNSIVVDLLKNSNPAVQEVGLYGAKTFPTAESFVIVAQAEDTLSTEHKVSAQAFLSTYGQGARLTALMSVLQVSDQAVVAKAAQVFVAGYQQAKSGTAISVPRNGRGVVSESSTVAAYLKFIPLLQTLSESSDSVLAALANSTLAQIQTA